MISPFFETIEPDGEDGPVVVEVPHASTFIPPPWLAQIVAPARSIVHDCDLYVDELFRSATRFGATLLVSRVSRYVIDLNRAESILPTDSKSKHGLIWSHTSGAYRLYERTPTAEDVRARIETIHRPYHQALSALLEKKRKRHGFVVLVAAHSMPSAKIGPPYADVVPGTQNQTTAARPFIAELEDHVRGHGWTFCHDEPYAGGFTTAHYGKPLEHVHAIQVELARRLYLDEMTLIPDATAFARVAQWCEGLIARLARVAE